MKFYANPYAFGVSGFYFETFAEYEEKAEALTDSSGIPVEEFEVEVIDGTPEEVELAGEMKIDQCNLEQCLEVLEGDAGQWPALFFLLNNHIVTSFDMALDKASDVCLYRGYLIDAATELFDECYAHDLPQEIINYIDYEAFARDRRLGGDMREFEFAGKTYTCTNANDI
jgi:hypothetical protein